MSQTQSLKYPTITQAELAGGYFSKHVTFVIKTPKNYVIKRRYTDFEWLRKWLLLVYPGAFIPPIPPKLPVAMWPTGYLLSRKRELQQFLQRIQIIRYLEKEEIVQHFLSKHPNNDFEKARKSWDKQHKKPSPSDVYNNLKSKFPGIDKAETPSDMPNRCEKSREAIINSITQLGLMVKHGESYIKNSENVEAKMLSVLDNFSKLFKIEEEGLGELETGNKYCNNVRLPMSNEIRNWQKYRREEYSIMKNYILPTLKRSLFDTEVCGELIKIRDNLIIEYTNAVNNAEKWKTKEITSKNVTKKHQDEELEKDLKNLSQFVNKLVLNQINIVWEANVRRWARAKEMFSNKLINELKNIFNIWKSIRNLSNNDKNLFNLKDDENLIIDLGHSDENHQKKYHSNNINNDNDEKENSIINSNNPEIKRPVEVNENINNNNNSNNKEEEQQEENNVPDVPDIPDDTTSNIVTDDGSNQIENNVDKTPPRGKFDDSDDDDTFSSNNQNTKKNNQNNETIFGDSDDDENTNNKSNTNDLFDDDNQNDTNNENNNQNNEPQNNKNDDQNEEQNENGNEPNLNDENNDQNSEEENNQTINNENLNENVPKDDLDDLFE